MKPFTTTRPDFTSRVFRMSACLLRMAALLTLPIIASAQEPQTGSAFSSTDAHAFVEYHNRVRSKVGVGPVEWSPEIAAHAQKWADAEIADYPSVRPIPSDFGGFMAGHYTQMVWRGTMRIGAGVAVVKSGRFKGSTLVVCNYDPPGNMIGEKPY